MRTAILGCAVWIAFWSAGNLYSHDEPPLRAGSHATFTSPDTCQGAFGHSRWAVKTETARPPLFGVGLRKVTPADIYAWRGPEVEITRSSPRIPAERKWYAVTGRVVVVYVEDDGDLHIVMQNTDGRRGQIVVEVPLGRPWRKLRATIFSWTNAKFPILPRDRDSFHVTQHPIVTVIGRAFYDVEHSVRNTRLNRRDYDRHIAVWEIHPVMRLVARIQPTAVQRMR